MTAFSKKFIGNKAFYRTVLTIAVPVVLQNGITQFVGVLDNIMVGRMGTEQMSGVAIANHLIFVFNLAIFGALSGAGIFGAQFSGKRDMDGVRHVLRFKLIVCAVLSLIAIAALILFSTPLLSLFLHEGDGTGDLALTLQNGREYLFISLIGLAPYALAQSYASTLRETGETRIPMLGSGAAVILNLVFNYLLIFGKLGFPALGVRGAALATVISRFFELLIIALYAHLHTKRFPFFSKLYSSLRIPLPLVKDITKKGAPLLFNELMWSLGMTMLIQRYSVRGLEVVAAQNISSTVSNLFNIVFMSVGSSIGIIVGNLLGANRLEEARDTDRKIIALSLFLSFFFAAMLALAAPFIPLLYKTTDDVRLLATKFLFVSAAIMPLIAFTHACYVTLRSGGQTRITLLFDSCFVWGITIPVAYVLSRFTSIPILPMFIIVNLTEIGKCVIGYVLVKGGKWIVNIVGRADAES